MTPQQANELLRTTMERAYKSLASAAMCQTRDGEAAWIAMGEALTATADCAPAPTEPAVDRTKLLPMQNDDDLLAGIVRQWYFDCDGHYIDVALDDGKYSILFKDRASKGTAWLDQADEVATPASPAVPARDHLLKIIAFAYQIAGAHDAPEHILAVLAHPESATAAQVDAMLPYQVGGGQAVPEPAPLAPRRSMSMFATLEDYRAAQASQPTSAEELQQQYCTMNCSRKEACDDCAAPTKDQK